MLSRGSGLQGLLGGEGALHSLGSDGGRVLRLKEPAREWVKGAEPRLEGKIRGQGFVAKLKPKSLQVERGTRRLGSYSMGEGRGLESHSLGTMGLMLSRG